MAEVNDQQLTALQRGFQILTAMNNDPKAREHLEAGLKVLDPNLKTTNDQVEELLAPRLQGVKDTEAKLTEALERLEKAEKARAEAEETAGYEQAFTRLRASEGLTAEGEEEVRKLMVDRKIADPEAAYALFQRQHPAVDTTSPSYVPQQWHFEDTTVADNLDLLWKKPELWTDQMIPQVLADERKQPARV